MVDGSQGEVQCSYGTRTWRQVGEVQQVLQELSKDALSPVNGQSRCDARNTNDTYRRLWFTKKPIAAPPPLPSNFPNGSFHINFHTRFVCESLFSRWFGSFFLPFLLACLCLCLCLCFCFRRHGFVVEVDRNTFCARRGVRRFRLWHRDLLPWYGTQFDWWLPWWKGMSSVRQRDRSWPYPVRRRASH
jgi:hypothetical protein